MKELKLTDKKTITITEQQAERIIEESASGKAGIVIDGEYIAFKAIYSITDKQEDNLDWGRSPHKVLSAPQKSKHTEEWLEATRRNKKRIEDGIRPFANWRVTTEGKIIEDPEYYKNNVTVLSDYR